MPRARPIASGRQEANMWDLKRGWEVPWGISLIQVPIMAIHKSKVRLAPEQGKRLYTRALPLLELRGAY